MKDDEFAGQSGALATRIEGEPDVPAPERVFSPLDFRLNLGARMADLSEPLPSLDNPAIRKLTWEYVVPDRSAWPPPSVATIAPVPVEDGVRQDVVEPEEINRLASVPDLIDDDSPIELLTITPSGPTVALVPEVYTPVLADSRYVAPLRPSTTAASAIPAPEATTSRRQVRGKTKRHPFRTFMTLVVVLGLLAGGAFAAKKYLLDQPSWSVELKPLADDVATTRGLQFKLAVEVTELPAGDYATRLAGSTIDAQVDHAPAWRALGLLNGDLQLEAIGRQAMNDSPAFYDPGSKTIFVTDDLKAYKHLYRFAMRRALTAALLDEQFDWGSRLVSASPAVALGIRATIDGDALVVANSLAASDAPDQLSTELLAFVQGGDDTPTPMPYAATITGRPGVTMRPTILGMGNDRAALGALEQATPNSDAVLDVSRPATATPSPAGTQGMMFWYYALASRIDDSQAWSAALRWTGDSLVTSTGSAAQCVDVKVAAADADGAAVLLGAFQSWAGSAPAESTTTVAPIDGNQVAIRACDPGAAVTAQIPAKVPVVFGGAGVERALVQAAVIAAGDVKVDAACLVNAARQRGTALTSPTDDAPVIVINWQSAYVAANLDLATGCVAAAG